jgi:hypothetical protein
MTEAMAASVAGSTQAQAAMKTIQPDDVVPVADCLITALQLVRPIIAADDDTRSEFDLMVRDAVLRYIADAFQSAHRVFPNAVSFQEPSAQA